MSRIIWLSPWLRPLARVQADALRELGHEVLLVTSDQHPESGAAQADELVLVPSPKQPASWPQFRAGLRVVRRFGAEVAITELVRDPRWMLFTRGMPRIAAVHDDRPHGANEQRPRWERALFDRWVRGADSRVAFSRHVADAIGTSDVIPLPSDLDPALVPDPAPARARRDVVLFGRLEAYKNLPVVLEAWSRHVDGPAFRGDELVLVGAGDLPAVPPHVRHVVGAFRYADVLPVLHRAKASLVHYRRASQSGVQVLSMQLGVVPVVSGEGALPEFQPPGEGPVPRDDAAGLAARLDELADPDAAAKRGADARTHYDTHYAATHAARRWDALVRATIGVHAAS